MTATTLPPDAAAPFDVRLLDVGDGHQIHVEQVGTPGGIPAIFLHGGPGSGCQPHQRALFDPIRFRAVFFDQRGAGRSRPCLGLEANTTAHLVADMERIRETLGIERWMLAGGSWGSTLALAYAERHPERVTGIVLRAIFLGTSAEASWAFIEGPRRFLPDLLETFLNFLPPEERAEPLPAYYKRLLDRDPAIQVPAAWVWHHFERALSELRPGGGIPNEIRTTGRPPPTAVMEAHYLSHDCFLAPGEIIANATRLADIPGIIVQSRYDLLCPPSAAFALHQAWPASTLRFIEGAGHAASEPGVTEALTAAINEVAGRA